ncbi:sporulation protein YunB [Paenibacillus sp. 79R4]|uniref:sporulation protein YunB n=1 Tax=Paenibacillus sp. 79R4 TaxID=2212847 RepID=UPI0009EEF93E|nr:MULTISPECIES: sporulation protein YunB [unclassified Paenibacillus]NWL88719.1 sporulation protein YunB [Paenibacillus sp. 79R4]
MLRFRRGWRSRRRRPRRKSGTRRWLWLIIVVITIFGFLQFYNYVEKHMKGPIMHLASIRVKQMATEAINEAITSQVANTDQVDRLIDWKMDGNGKVSGFMLNYSSHMKITSDTIATVRDTLEEVSHLSETIPLGQALGSPILASFGPRIPIKIEPQGDVKVDLSTRKQDAGINMILVEVYLRVKAELAVVVPFDMEPQSVETEIPVSYLLVVGDVPMYYYDSKGNPVGNQAGAPNIAIPAPKTGEQQPQEGSNSPIEGTVPSTEGQGDGQDTTQSSQH